MYFMFVKFLDYYGSGVTLLHPLIDISTLHAEESDLELILKIRLYDVVGNSEVWVFSYCLKGPQSFS